MKDGGADWPLRRGGFFDVLERERGMRHGKCKFWESNFF